MKKFNELNKYFEKIHVSALTASKLGLINIKSFADSKQAYLMVGEKCLFSCSFCSQSSDSTTSTNFLSRVTWPPFNIDIVIDAFKKKLRDNPEEFKKICFQVVTTENYFNRFLKTIKIFQKEINLPISTSISIFSEKQVEILLNNGIYSIGYAMDVASRKLYKKIKNRDFDKDKKLLLKLGQKYPGRVSIHLIAGLGENDKEFLELTKDALLNNIIFALFAFTPIPGTKMENSPKISIRRYRILQFLITLMKLDNPINIFNNIDFNESGYVKSLNDFGYYFNKYKKDFEKGNFLVTMGCPYCNRPFYNDKPSDKRLFNYPIAPSKNVVFEELKELKTFFQTN